MPNSAVRGAAAAERLIDRVTAARVGFHRAPHAIDGLLLECPVSDAIGFGMSHTVLSVRLPFQCPRLPLRTAYPAALMLPMIVAAPDHQPNIQRQSRRVGGVLPSRRAGVAFSALSGDLKRDLVLDASSDK
jgi:hypothetical protein